MKTEKEFADFFIDSCRHDPQFNEYVLNVSKTYWVDLTTHLSGHFSNEDRLAITKKAAELLSDNLKNSRTDLAWSNVIRDFVVNSQWGYNTTNTKPTVKKTEEQKIFWRFFKYAWAFFQSMIILKIAVYYYGLESAEHPDEVSVGWVWLFFGISVGSLFFFAYRNRNEKD